ncbi:MAG TPA: hypothetical protein VGF02_01500 [Pseudolabrys sp.]|jgi:hypothetical protein
MKKTLHLAILAAAIAAGVALTPAAADDAKSDRVIKPSHMKKSKQNRPAVKDTANQTDYYIRAREIQMKISM